MRITLFLLTILLWAFIIQGFNAPKCKHVFTQVEQATVKIDRPDLELGGVIYKEGEESAWPSGKVEGAELICVKCFHKQKQILDYGEPTSGIPFDAGVNALAYDSIALSNWGSTLKVDTTAIIGLKVAIIKGDTVYGIGK